MHQGTTSNVCFDIKAEAEPVYRRNDRKKLIKLHLAEWFFQILKLIKSFRGWGTSPMVLLKTKKHVPVYNNANNLPHAYLLTAASLGPLLFSRNL